MTTHPTVMNILYVYLLMFPFLLLQSMYLRSPKKRVCSSFDYCSLLMCFRKFSSTNIQEHRGLILPPFWPPNLKLLNGRYCNHCLCRSVVINSKLWTEEQGTEVLHIANCIILQTKNHYSSQCDSPVRYY